ncbi:MAG: 30S ribosomal protein S12 methylthiotransferase RimO [bacterium]
MTPRSGLDILGRPGSAAPAPGTPSSGGRAGEEGLFTVSFVTLGCAKNVVDSEKALGALARDGFRLSDDPEDADLIVVNTCGFIEDAREESVDEILRMAELKRTGRPKRLVVAGCLSVRCMEELRAELPEVDRFTGLVDPEEMRALARSAAEAEGRAPTSCEVPGQGGPAPRMVTTPKHYAWLKIAEGCSNPCTFCAIPIMRGPIRSSDPEDLLAEARQLTAGGARELIIVAQDTTHYGVDLTDRPKSERPGLGGLIRRLGTEVEGLAWLRLMYAYPAHVTDDLLEAVATTPKVVPYVDIPVQHASERMLKAMRRTIGASEQRDLLARMRERIPGLALRTSVITGFPGETDRDVAELIDFVREVRFERLGVFTYSPEEGTPASGMAGEVPREEAERRKEAVMEAQREIAVEHNRALTGAAVEVMVEEVLEDLPPFRWLGRTPWDAPEVDQGIYLEMPSGEDAETRRLEPGDRVRAEVVGSTDFDLEGVLLPEPPR